jgi:hypothetical protein
MMHNPLPSYEESRPMPSVNAPPPIRTDHTNPFAHHTMRVRVPAIVQQTIDANPDYPASIRQRLAALRTALENDAPIPPLDLPAPDLDEWALACSLRAGHTWGATDWFFAETYVYRLIIQATRFYETGRDPFAPIKAEEYAGEALWTLLDAALSAQYAAPEDRLSACLALSLWGNRIDLSYAASRQHGTATTDDDLLVDGREPMVRLLLRLREAGKGYVNRAVHLVADNAGTELTMDLVLIDALLDTCADHAILHLKAHPTFVSDAIPADVLNFIAACESGARGGAVRAFGGRLRTAFEAGRLRLAPDLYWNSSRFLWELPNRLTTLLRGTNPVIVKGDANYRRIVGDAVWEPTVPFASVMRYFPAPLLALRSLKSDPIVGLDDGQVEALDARDPKWRTNGRRGVIQFYSP